MTYETVYQIIYFFATKPSVETTNYYNKTIRCRQDTERKNVFYLQSYVEKDDDWYDIATAYNRELFNEIYFEINDFSKKGNQFISNKLSKDSKMLFEYITKHNKGKWSIELQSYNPETKQSINKYYDSE